MGHEVFSRDSYTASRRSYGVSHDTGVTRHAEEETRRTGRPSAIVDPAIDQIRRSLIRLDPENGKFRVTVGCPIDVTVDCDTTGSMGGEVDTEMRVLPDLYELCARVLPGRDPQLCLGIFGDCEDRIVYCRPQFEMTAPKIVNYLKEMSPQRGGAGNNGEDPQYALFARAYLTDAYTNKISIKGYHFVVTDEPAHNSLRKGEIERIFGSDVWGVLKENGYDLENEFPDVETVVRALQNKTHAYVLVLEDDNYDAREKWSKLYGEDRVIIIPNTEVLPAVISAIIGLTEGTLELTKIEEFLEDANVDGRRISKLSRALSKVKVGEQLKLIHETGHELPKAGDIFEKKSDLWPISTAEETSNEESAVEDDGSSMNWL